MSYSQKYIQYLKSNQWKQRRYATLERAKFKCQFEKCGEKRYLSVHHKTYDRLGNEDPSDLIVLCSGHHWYADKLRKHPDTQPYDKKDKYDKAKLCRDGKILLLKFRKTQNDNSEMRFLSKSAKRKRMKTRKSLEKHIRLCSECVYI